MNSKNKILSFAMLVLLTGCAADEWQQSRQDSSGLIEFTASSSPSIDVTRGNDHSLKLSGYTTDLWLLPTVTPTSELDATRGTQFGSKSVLSSFGVSAYQYNNSEGISDKRPEFFYNKEAVRNSITGKYNIAQEYYWPSSDECLTFMAYAPYGSTYVKLSDVDDSERAVGPQKLYFTIASDVTAQIDLMTATAAGLTLTSSAKPSVSMQFQHQLAGIRFVAGSQFPHQGYVQTITLKKNGHCVPKLEYDFVNCPDLAQTFVVACAAMNIPFHFTGLSTLKIKETDRIEALKTEMRKLGYVVKDIDGSELLWDGERCEPSLEQGIDTYEDHRMALAFAPYAMKHNGLVINNPQVVTKSYPHYWDHLRQAGFKVE